MKQILYAPNNIIKSIWILNSKKLTNVYTLKSNIFNYKTDIIK